MRASVRLILLAVSTLLGAACGEPTGPAPRPAPITRLPRSLTAGETELVAAGNRFAFALFRTVALEVGADANVFVSPLSVGMALGMTVNGAAGATRDSMLAALQLTGMPMDEVNRGYRGVIDLLSGLDPGVTFTLANSIWYRSGISPGQAFLDATRTWFDAQVQALDFGAPGAARTINDWVNEQTRGRIPEIVDDPIPGWVIMYLINAIYFKGSWTQRFDPALTHDAPFTLRSGAAIPVAMMAHRDPAPARSVTGDGVTVVDLPYGGGAWAMTIVLPPSAAGIDSLAASLTGARWDGWMAGLDSEAVIVTMPKFKLAFEQELHPALAALGMGIAFECGAADFTPLNPAGGTETCITRVKHKTYVDVDEEGTEAAAVTSVEVSWLTSVQPGPLRIVVDRPFLVAIRERLTGTILFLGKVMNPAGL
jgi:serine protease inhibitor